MKSYIKEFLAEYDYPDPAREALVYAYDTIVSSEKGTAFLSLLEEYERSYHVDYTAILDKMQAISTALGIHEYTGVLLLFICYSKRLKEYYKAEDLSEEIYKTCMFDLKYKLIECKSVKNVWGSFVPIWFVGFFNLTRFAFCKLQFEIIDFKDNYNKNGVCLTPQSKVINVHIPRTGGRLDEESRKRSYAMAAEFFATRFGMDPIVFVCNSWLLFPKHKQIMKKGSNLLAFIEDYDIYKSGEYKNYDEIWRLFDVEYNEDHTKLPADTSLRREYIKMMDNGEKIGFGKGVYIYKPKA